MGYRRRTGDNHDVSRGLLVSLFAGESSPLTRTRDAIPEIGGDVLCHRKPPSSMVAYAVQRRKRRPFATERNGVSYVGTGTSVPRCTTPRKACTSVRSVGASFQCTVGFLPTRQYSNILPGSRSTRTCETRKQVYQSRRFRSYSILHDEYSTFRRFRTRACFPVRLSRTILPLNPHNLKTVALSYAFPISIR